MRSLIRSSVLAAVTALAACAPDAPTGVHREVAAPTFAKAATSASWAPAIRVELIPGTHPEFNTAFLDGCPFISADGRTFYMASNRPGGYGGLDIWVATRERTDDPWGAPVNAGPTLNTSANDFCPTLARDGHTFFFASNRPGGCGGDDLYVTRRRGDGSYDAPENLGCQVNSVGNEAGPSHLTEPGSGPVLYFSSTRAGGPGVEAPGALTGDADIYRSAWHGGAFGPAALVPGVNSVDQDGQPNVQRDGRELYFFSNRAGTLGGNDIYVATRATAHDAWSAPANLGPNVNSAASETRPSLSWDGATLYFGSTRPGSEMQANGMPSNDIYVTTRQHAAGGRG